jgi:hypothetical protein
LNGDGADEIVVADMALCSAAGNCYWNVFVPALPRGAGGSTATPCTRYAGTLAGVAMDRLAERGEHGFVDLRAWWRFGAGGRLLMQQYRFRHGGYRVVDALLCRRQSDDRIACAPAR